MFKRLLLVMTLLIAGVACSAALAQDEGSDVCVPVDEHWQRYSWTGGPLAEDDPPPAFPDDGWQPNVQGDPHGIGVAGAYFVSHGGSGLGDWFYLELVPGVDCPPPTTIPDDDPPPTTVPPDTTVPPTTEPPVDPPIDNPPDPPPSIDIIPLCEDVWVQGCPPNPVAGSPAQTG